MKAGLVASPQTGRLIIALAHKADPEPRTLVEDTDRGGPVVAGADANEFAPGGTVAVDGNAIAYPMGKLADLPTGDYVAQALLICNHDLLSPETAGNLYSAPKKIHFDAAKPQKVALELTSQIPAEEAPKETELVKFVKIQSQLLSRFHGRPIYLRAGIILPGNYWREPNRRYPLWVRIGGLDTRYTHVLSLMEKKLSFERAWMAPGAPQMILMHLDGAGPFGDAYQVNSANNGPYGDAITQELIPYVEAQFRCVGQPHARVLSGVSTGGWSSLALQVFYPDYFNGVWSFCPDGVDFRAFELVNIYGDPNAYVNAYGFERPSERTVTGETKLTMRREVLLENVLGRGDSYTLSGGQWGAWNATYGPRRADGLPTPLWDPETGVIDHETALQWKKYDLRIVLENNWKTLGPKLQGKIHIAVAEADNYFLNNAVHLMDDFLSQATPPYGGQISYGPGQGHGWTGLSEADLMQEIARQTK